MSMPASPPDTRAAGQSGHLADHAAIADDLTWLANAVGALQASSPSAGVSGDLSGTLPGPTVAKVNGVAVSGTPAAGSLLVATAANAAAWEAPVAAGLVTAAELSAAAAAAPAQIPVMTGGGHSIWVQATAPSSPAVGDIWVPTTPLAPASLSTGSQQSFQGPIAAPAVGASGLTGATAASRYVGATASGPPASGTFAKGDFIIDQTGAVWACTTAGSPGTWIRFGLTAVRPIAPQAGEYLVAPNTGQTVNGVATPANGVMFLTPLDVAFAQTFVKIACCVTTGGSAGALFRLGLYADDGTGSRPTGPPLLDSGAVAATAVGDQNVTVSYPAQPGRIWIGLVTQGAPGTLPSYMSSSIIFQIPPTNLSTSGLGTSNFSTRGWQMTGVTGALPVLSGLTKTNGNAPYVGLGA